ncbi:tubulin--tyrosine ligase-like protein 12 [Phlebotomus argentipes]|uniref:tubulin--tyrosine ligase-like protein 12 n=1 Tax=Phlebotomus argentipes TaxID=94469 RepID=UPI002893323D|nr:tubulin--tyrosine ligase-like protein 12 [Phlebotomus argentipes]
MNGATEDGSNYESFLTLHEPQLRQSAVPPHFWPSLCNKLYNQIFDAGDFLSLLLLDYGEGGHQEDDPVWTVVVSKPGGIEESDRDAIFLVDHAWTFRMDSAQKQLEQMPSLLKRMCMIMGVDQENETQEVCVKKVMRRLWRYNSMYSVNATGISIESQMPIWYIMDEVGSGIQHCDTPNFRVVPFLHLPDQVTYSILFPVVDCEEDEIVTRDYVEQYNADDEKKRNALLLPWKYTDFSEEDFVQVEPEKEYFLGGRMREESLPDADKEEPEVDANRPLRVYADYTFVNKYLTDEAFEIVDSPDDADVLWLSSHFKDYLEFSQQNPNKFINQFPYENVLTVKDLLSIVCRRVAPQHSNANTLETYPKWLPTTFNLNTELIQFVSYYQQREAQNLDNHWICKPWNLARGLDMHITSDIGHIMRLPATGPKIAQKYVEHPVLFTRTDLEGARVKFDVRYVILLKSINPLSAHVHRNFFLRFANRSYRLDDGFDYETHFTVMNYSETADLHHLPCAEFLIKWSEQYPEHPWDEVEVAICEMLREMLSGAVQKVPPCGLGANLQSRALYAADIILSWDDGKIQPKLLEVNWMPDCQRACEYYPEFYNDVFKLLFLNQDNATVFRSLVN